VPFAMRKRTFSGIRRFSVYKIATTTEEKNMGTVQFSNFSLLYQQ